MGKDRNHSVEVYFRAVWGGDWYLTQRYRYRKLSCNALRRFLHCGVVFRLSSVVSLCYSAMNGVVVYIQYTTGRNRHLGTASSRRIVLSLATDAQRPQVFGGLSCSASSRSVVIQQ